ncbi:MAG: membrane integrity-associated transporter subunit PqiC [Magnetococcales bacterium]|nr:membrane integrity-associated transporter subunit PqiC [Magnetococcales bacterium]
MRQFRHYAVLLFLLVTACASPSGGGGGSAVLRHFVLMPTATGRLPALTGSHSGYTLEVLQVAVPSYLNRSQIVTRPGPHELDLSEAHQWGDTLSEGVTRTVATNLARLLGSDRVFPRSPYLVVPANYRLATEINRFEQDADGAVVLDLYWRLFAGNDTAPVLERRADWRSEAVSTTDYAVLVAAMSRLLGDFSLSVAREMSVISTPVAR